MSKLTSEQSDILARLQSGRLMICEGQGDPNSDGCGGQGYAGATGMEPCPHCFGVGVMTPDLQSRLASLLSTECVPAAWLYDFRYYQGGEWQTTIQRDRPQSGGIAEIRNIEPLYGAGSGPIADGAVRDILALRSPELPAAPQATAEPVAWAWEQYEPFEDYWLPKVAYAKPDKSYRLRNIRPLYAAPAASRIGVSEEEIARASTAAKLLAAAIADYADAPDSERLLLCQPCEDEPFCNFTLGDLRALLSAHRDGGETQ